MTQTVEQIGSREFAKELATKDSVNWNVLGAGAFRTVYLGPDGFAYKKDTAKNYLVNYGSNKHEEELFTLMRNKGFLWVPTSTLYRFDDEDIMVMPVLHDVKWAKDIVGNEENLRRYDELGKQVLDSGIGNCGINPETNLLYLRDGGNGSWEAYNNGKWNK